MGERQRGKVNVRERTGKVVGEADHFVVPVLAGPLWDLEDEVRLFE
jgi:hypothetical protein